MFKNAIYNLKNGCAQVKRVVEGKAMTGERAMTVWLAILICFQNDKTRVDKIAKRRIEKISKTRIAKIT